MKPRWVPSLPESTSTVRRAPWYAQRRFNRSPWPRLPAHEGSGAAESWRRRRGSTMVDHRSWPAMASAATAVYQFIASLPRWALWSVRVPSPEVLASKPARLATSQREEAVPTIRWSRCIGVALLRGRFRRATGQEPANATASGNAACRYGVGSPRRSSRRPARRLVGGPQADRVGRVSVRSGTLRHDAFWSTGCVPKLVAFSLIRSLGCERVRRIELPYSAWGEFDVRSLGGRNRLEQWVRFPA